jgi:hypothetical protein
MEQRLIKSRGCEPTPIQAHCSIPAVKPSGKRLGDIEGHLVSHDVITVAAQLVRYRLDRQHTVALGLLSLIEAFDPRIVSDGKVGRFDKRPSQILIPVLGIAAAFLFTVA